MIYIVEDDDAVRDSLRLVLEGRGYGVAEFTNSESFFAHGRFTDAHCIVLDVNLPGESGLEILSRLRRDAIGTPVIVVSGRASDDMKDTARRLDAIAFFDKPVRSLDLLASISKIAEHAGG